MTALAVLLFCALAGASCAQQPTNTTQAQPPTLNLGAPCGVYEINEDGLREKQTPGIAGCFLGAWEGCAPASFSTVFVDTYVATDYTYVVLPTTPCAIVIRTEGHANGTITYQPDRRCTGVAAEPYGLHVFSCGNSPDELVVTVHDADAMREGEECGEADLTSELVATDPAQLQPVASCIATAFAACQPATARMLSGGDSSAYLVEHDGDACLLSRVTLKKMTEGGYEMASAEPCSQITLADASLTFACVRAHYTITW
jgi:hypothetical protein